MVTRPTDAKIQRYPYDQFRVDLEELGKKVKEQEKKIGKKFEAIFAIHRGGLILGVCLSHELKIPLLERKDELSNFLPGEILVVDDIADYGRALRNYSDAGYTLLTISVKPRSAVKPEIYLHLVENDVWVSHWWGDGDGRYLEE